MSSTGSTFLLFVIGTLFIKIGTLFIKAVYFSLYSNSLEVPYQSGLNLNVWVFFNLFAFLLRKQAEDAGRRANSIMIL